MIQMKKRKMKKAHHIRVKVMKLMMIFSFVFFSQQSLGLEKQLIEEYKKIRTEIEDNKFAISDNYYFLFGSVTVEDYEDDAPVLDARDHHLIKPNLKKMTGGK